jgi:hypothetical protein
MTPPPCKTRPAKGIPSYGSTANSRSTRRVGPA